MKITIDTEQQKLYIDKNLSIKELTDAMNGWDTYTVISTVKPPKGKNLTGQELIDSMPHQEIQAIRDIDKYILHPIVGEDGITQLHVDSLSNVGPWGQLPPRSINEDI